jgi:hypothetical protein
MQSTEEMALLPSYRMMAIIVVFMGLTWLICTYCPITVVLVLKYIGMGTIVAPIIFSFLTWKIDHQDQLRRAIKHINNKV